MEVFKKIFCSVLCLLTLDEKYFCTLLSLLIMKLQVKALKSEH